MKNEIKELKAELLKVFSKFEENECEPKTILTDKDEEGWYINKFDIALHKHGQSECLGIFYTGEIRRTARWIYNGLCGTWRKATPSEVIEAFTNYFRSQGWVSGKTKFKDACEDVTRIYIEPISVNECGVYADDGMGRLFFNDTLTLVTKIEDEKIMVDGKEVEFWKGFVLIEGHMFTPYEIKPLLTLNPIFQKILDKLNEK